MAKLGSSVSVMGVGGHWTMPIAHWAWDHHLVMFKPSKSIWVQDRYENDFLSYLSRKTLHVIVFKIGFSPPWFLQNIGKCFQVLDLGLIKVVLTDVKCSLLRLKTAWQTIR